MMRRVHQLSTVVNSLRDIKSRKVPTQPKILTYKRSISKIFSVCVKKFSRDYFWGNKVPLVRIWPQNRLRTKLKSMSTPLTHLIYYLQGWGPWGLTDKNFGKMAANRQASLVIISDMNCLSLDSEGKVY